MRAILFPGQGSQYVGMGSDFYKKFDIVKKIFKEVDESLCFKLSKYLFLFHRLRFMENLIVKYLKKLMHVFQFRIMDFQNIGENNKQDYFMIFMNYQQHQFDFLVCMVHHRHLNKVVIVGQLQYLQC